MQRLLAVTAVCLLAQVQGRQLLAPAPAPSATFSSISAALNSTSYLSMLAQAVGSAGLTSTFSNPGMVSTVFAPSNAAITAFMNTLGLTSTQLLASPLLAPILSYHVVPGAATMTSQLTNGLVESTLLAGQNVTVLVLNAPTPSPVGGTVTSQSLGLTVNVAAPAPGITGVPGAMHTPFEIRGYASTVDVIVPNIMAGNSVVHVVDGVLIPNTAILGTPAAAPVAAIARAPASLAPATSGSG